MVLALAVVREEISQAIQWIDFFFIENLSR